MKKQIHDYNYDGLHIRQVPCRKDNYGYLLQIPGEAKLIAIDTPDPEPLMLVAEEMGSKIGYIVNTHHHIDHICGNLPIKNQTHCKIIGFTEDRHRIDGIDLEIDDGEAFFCGDLEFHLIHTPGHTQGHVTYWLPKHKIAFVGDVLFAMGCGRLLEGSADQLYHSLKRITAVCPDEAMLFCAHEYSLTNARFALTVEPDNIDLQARAQQVQRATTLNQPTVPMTLAEEKATNPFLRLDSSAIHYSLNMPSSNALAIFTELRRRRDQF